VAVNLVTGDAGFIGSNLTRELLARGGWVRILANFSAGHRDNLKGLESVEIIGRRPTLL
jgi:nucleoside-diphosphate-sugar epimerase